MESNILNNCVKYFNQIDSAKDLKTNKITYSDLEIIFYILKEAINSKNKYSGETISENVARWFMRKGATVRTNEVGWIIHF